MVDSREFNSYIAGTQLTISWFELIPSGTSNAYQLFFSKQIAYPIQVFSSTNLLSRLLILFLVPPANHLAKSGLRIPPGLRFNPIPDSQQTDSSQDDGSNRKSHPRIHSHSLPFTSLSASPFPSSPLRLCFHFLSPL